MPSFRIETRRPVDLYTILAATPLLLLVVALVPGVGILRVPLGLVFVLLFPGYVLVAALFPARRGEGQEKVPGALGGLERSALSLGMSIAVVPLLGLALNFTPWGIRQVPVLVTLAGFNLVLGSVALARRGRVPPPAQPRFGLQLDVPAWRALGALDRALAVGVVVALLAAAGSVAYVAMAPRPGEAFTEFYILGPEGLAEDYPTTLAAGETGHLLVGIRNHENRDLAYELVATLVRHERQTNETGDDILVERERHTLPGHVVSLPDEGETEFPYSFTVNESGPAKLLLELRVGDGQAPYRSLHLWINARGAEGA